jgi:hypothetical protein
MMCNRYQIVLACILFHAPLFCGCEELAVDGPAADESSEDSESGDNLALKMINENDVAEAREWLAIEKDHHLWKVDRATVKPLVEKLYAAGSPKVYATGTKPADESPTQMVAMFMAEVPDDPAVRSRIFQVQADFWKSYLDDPDQDDLDEVIEKDEGQKYLFINFDL